MGPRPHPEPVRSTTLPTEPWMDIAIDLCGPLPSGEQLFVAVDYYSRWPEVVWLKDTSTKAIIKCLETIFLIHGLPVTIRSDNGPQFAAKEFEAFCDYLGILHVKGIPYWPQSNAEVERFNATLMKVVKMANAQKQDLKRELGNFLFQYRSTPHGTTGVSPAELLMKRKLRDKLPQFTDRTAESDWQRLVRDRDAHRKLVDKQYADKRRRAADTDIQIGDLVLLQARKHNKLSCNYEAEPVTVVAKEGNAIQVQTPDGIKMRNVAHARKFIEPPPPMTLDSDLRTDSVPDDSVTDLLDSPSHVQNRPDVRRSSRPSTKPAYLDNYVC